MNPDDRVQRDYQAIATKEIELRNAKAEYLATGALWLKEKRKWLGLSLRQVAEMCSFSHGYIFDIEQGRRPLPSVIFQKLRLL